jgi:hypothetical protein
MWSGKRLLETTTNTSYYDLAPDGERFGVSCTRADSGAAAEAHRQQALRSC